MSLIVATLMATVFMLAALGVAEVWVRIFQENGDFDMSKRTENLAESVVNFARYKAGDKVGANIKSEDLDEADLSVIFKTAKFADVENCEDIDKNPLNGKQRCLGFRIIGRSEAELVLNNSNYYYSAPAAYKDDNGEIKGTGNAASECKDSANADDPCHWNKLYLGQAVKMPLYYEDENKNIKKISGSLGSFKLRIRAPCSDEYGEFKSNDGVNFKCENLVLYPAVSGSKKGPFRHIEKDKVLIQWILKGGEELFARDVLDPNNEKLRYSLKSTGDEQKNTELSAGRINKAKEGGLMNNYVVLEETHDGENLNNKKYTISDIISSASNPVLRLNFVSQARSEDNNDNFEAEFTSDQLNSNKYFIPYLEYQILTNEPIADSTTTLFGWAEISDFYKISEGKRTFPVTTDPFALGNM